jgi:hypothetical protein
MAWGIPVGCVYARPVCPPKASNEASNNGTVRRIHPVLAFYWPQWITEKVIWHMVEDAASTAGITKLSPHDCRRTCARLCHAAVESLNKFSSCWGTFR